MATDLFDPAKIDAAVGEAFGTRMPTRQPSSPQRPAGVVTDELLDRLRRVESGKDPLAVNKETKAMGPYQFLPETVQMLHRQGVKFNPFDEKESREAARTYLGQLVQRHNGNIELALKDYGGFVTKDPTKYVQKVTGAEPTAGRAAPAAALAAPAASTPGQLTVEDLMKPEAINAAVTEAFSAPAAPTKTEKATGAVANKVRSLLRSGAALADTLYSPVPAVAGMVTYAGARAAGQTPEQAGETQAKVTGALERPIGKAAGVTETPEYKGEVTQRLMDFIGENVSKGADWISKQTGMAKPEVEYYMNLGMVAAPGAGKAVSKTKPGQVVSREVGYVTEAAKQAGGKVVEGVSQVTPAPVRNVVRGTVEAIAPGATKPPTVSRFGQLTPEDSIRAQLGYGPADQTFPKVVSNTRGSVGAMGVPDTTIINQALQNASPQLRQAVSNIPVDKANTPAIMRMIEADSLYVPMQLTEGMATGSLKYLSEEKNLRAKYPEIANRIQELNQQLIDNFAATRERTAPDVFSTSKMEASQGIIDAYKVLDAQKDAAINGAYTKLRDAAGGNLPIDAPTLLKNIDATLSKELLLTDGRGISQYRELANKAKTGQMTFDEYLAMRRNLSRLSAEAKDGNARQAARLMVQELDKLPLTQEVANLKPLADEARNLARQRFDALKKDPAYKAAVNDTVPADKYLDKFVIGGVNKNINTMIKTLGRDSPAHQHIKAGTLYWLQQQAKIINDRGNFSEAGFKNALNKLDSVKNFQTIFDPETQLQLRTMDNVAHYVKFQPEGHWINNSGTWVNLKAYGAKGLEGLGNIAGLKFVGGVPVGTIVRQKIAESAEKKRVQKALQPGAGARLEDISRQGQRQPPTPPAEKIEPRLD